MMLPLVSSSVASRTASAALTSPASRRDFSWGAAFAYMDSISSSEWFFVVWASAAKCSVSRRSRSSPIWQASQQSPVQLGPHPPQLHELSGLAPLGEVTSEVAPGAPDTAEAAWPGMIEPLVASGSADFP